ncbi:putative iron-regulated protein [Pleurocapsa sp. PCC 7327]|uniref:Fe2+-dependent dioxygenase n=1 Tax=Pleurocapsa sp. PCC 7327 TaxID=118163 RepID=UPI00029F90E6|nr:Fe2+-dependent dioxygenase [Pleurocapsa sp. PCC 7327]AFY77130.1 putative iron-regulated protein [Pleurocapsa sp. PCC 7327]
MILAIDNILTPEELQFVVESLSQANFVDGKMTAGWHAKLVKNNIQLEKTSERAVELTDLVKAVLERNLLLKTAVLPKIIHSILFSRYEKGMSYGSHTDNAFMGKWRSDVSFTLFLSSPNTYSGGELVVATMDGDRSYKLEAGSAIVYPSSMLHRVEPVTEGVRLVAVGWIQSLVRDPSEREILFELDTVRRSIFAKEGKTLEFDLLSKTHSNLLRKWAD